MNITLIGATGFTGSAILNELLARGHQVSALVRQPGKLAAHANLRAHGVDVLDTAGLTELVRGSDAVVSAFSGHARHEDMVDYYLRGVRSIVAAVKAAGVARLLMVGGAGSLYVGNGQQLIDTPEFPPAYKASAEGARQALNLLRDEATLNWTMLSPSALLQDGPRTGQFRIGSDHLLVDGAGNSSISVADLALAMADEVATAAHPRRRFTIGY